MAPTDFVIYYLVGVNMVAFALYGLDKFKAKRSLWRIPEITLILVAVLAGSLGAWLGMKVWHHKTQHPLFYIGIPTILALQLSLIAYLIIA